MKITASIGFVLVFGSFLGAQTYVPAAYAKIEGNVAATACPIGAFPSSRMQLAEGEFGSAHAVRRMGFRLDGNYNYNAATGMGRTWSKVTIDVCDTDLGKFTTTFSTNVLTKTTRVFDAKYSWPSQTGQANTAPAYFRDEHSFGFSSPYQATGKNQLLFDMVFSSGVLSNGIWPTNGSYYVLDGITASNTAPGFNNSGGTTYVPSLGNQSCGDPGQSGVFAAFTTSGSRAYNNKPSNGALANKTQLIFDSFDTAPGKSVIHVLAVAGLPKGANINAGCNLLYLNLSAPSLFMVRTASTGSTAFASSNPAVPNNLLPGGLTVWGQGAWNNSKTNAFSLTGACHHKLPAPPPDLMVRQRAMTWAISTTSTVGQLVARPGSVPRFAITKYSSK